MAKKNHRGHGKRGIEVLRDWVVESLGRWVVESLGRCFVGRVEKTTEDTEIYREHRKTFLCVLCVSLRLCVNLGVLCVLGDLGVPIHRLTQIYTDWRKTTEDTENYREHRKRGLGI